jgi:uncharacterized protein YutE (UPF0331/DUF86 family)/predicted nucleotidyltransferase
VRVRERIKRQVELVEEFTRELEFEKSYRGVERLVQLTIQALLDLGSMIIAVLNAPRPRSYSEIAHILRDLGVLGEEDANLLRALAGLRNILVHGYAVIDREKIVEFSRRLRSDATRIAHRLLSSVESSVDPATLVDEVASVVEKVKSVLAGRVTLAYLFGSRSRGYTLRGDYDIAVYVKSGCDPYELGLLVVEVARVLGVSEEGVDVVCVNNSPPELVYEALSGIPVVVEDPDLALMLKYRALLELLDLEETRRLAYKT